MTASGQKPNDVTARDSSTVRVLGVGGAAAAMLVVSVLLVLVLTGREAACTLKGGDSYISLDTTALPIVQLDRTEVCIDERCTRLGWLNQVTGAVERRPSFQIDGREQKRTLVVRSLDGEILAGPASIELEDVYPNGKGCTPELLGGSFTAQADGAINQDSFD